MNKLLIANRGEIAIRVIKTAKKMGIKTVAVFSEADRHSRHVFEADEAYCIGPAPSADSYLRIDKIIEVCKKSKADAVHPGYGFLSENTEFAQTLQQNNITFIGPSVHSIELMGKKIESKQAVAEYGVPLVPGLKEAITDSQQAAEIAREIGFPVLVKASAGGGGKGMRIVNENDDILKAIESAQNEARNAFGNDAVFIEKYVASPRHIEIQIVADQHGNYFYLHERECSIQRRHQKLVEEAPSAILNEELRQKMGQAAINVAKAAKYYGAGTVEFLLDENYNFYFLEMNTRLQVEHPVTELITGIDLVETQIQIARGEKLNWIQKNIPRNGHSIELRLCAENPFEDFLPAIGSFEKYNKPSFDFVRIDDFVDQGYEIPIYYDNMFAKLIVWGHNRAQAIERMKMAIRSFEIIGITNTLSFGEFVMNHPNFINGQFDTHFIKNYWTKEAIEQFNNEEQEALAIFSDYILSKEKIVLPNHKTNSPWLNSRK